MCVVAHIGKTSTWQPEAEDCYKFEANLDYTVRPFLKNKERKKKGKEAKRLNTVAWTSNHRSWEMEAGGASFPG